LVLFGATGLLLSALGFALMVAAAGGTALNEIEPALLDAVLHETAAGTSFKVRMAALILLIIAGLLALRSSAAGLLTAIFAGAVALGTLAWNGHAAASEGALATVHLASDLLHLWAAGLWVGALFGLLALVFWAADAARLGLAHRALSGFSRIGTLAVLVLLATGIVNGAIILGIFEPAAFIASPYGKLLLLKLGLFALMLALAAANRFSLTPALGSALHENDISKLTVGRLRASIALETTAALGILALVAWLGMLEPAGSS
jgi:putative copper resistance protein D